MNADTTTTTADTTTAQPIDPNDLEAFAQRLRDMPEEHVYQILRAVQDDIARRNEDGLPALVRAACVAAGYKKKRIARAVAVTFPTWEWDNGWFYNPYEGRVYLNAGTYVEVDFSGTPVGERLTQLSSDAQPLGEMAGMRIDLLTGDVEHDEYLYNHI